MDVQFILIETHDIFGFTCSMHSIIYTHNWMQNVKRSFYTFTIRTALWQITWIVSNMYSIASIAVQCLNLHIFIYFPFTQMPYFLYTSLEFDIYYSLSIIIIIYRNLSSTLFVIHAISRRQNPNPCESWYLLCTMFFTSILDAWDVINILKKPSCN